MLCSGVKIDSCGSQKNMTLYAELFNATGKPIITENCHQGQNFTDGGDPGQMGPGWCPYNFFRTSGNMLPSFALGTLRVRVVSHF